ncbi:tripartite tricarboxylate transporter substrate binding protein [Polaromonas sp. SM01]|uniref:Bug family tripartite tricarboxylate transporter substrate binding protein n=1 Tax=Polaromonas sp. SM01 TaxID=3085630 RepID=UPI00298237F6|nr:tripartite tricarboxylate transporter substrate binding protein [Polaromonas sp. SM01]MDW5444152.1 tripartite tricarboxylate transporter substrate binding protein [Polaromonas sp. SM01]
MKFTFNRRTALTALALCGLSFGAIAQDFPNKPLKIVVAYPPGGAADILARDFGQKLQLKLNQPVIVENKPGAGTLLAAAHVARAPADGHTMLLTTNTTLIAPQLQGSSPVEVMAELKPVASLTEIVFVLVATKELPQKTLPELMAHMKTQPGAINYATPSQGGITHLIGLQIQDAYGVKMTTVPYKGTAPALTDLISGRVEVMLDAIATSQPYIKDGRLRALGIADDKSWDGMPEIPPIFSPGQKFSRGWYALFTAAGAPERTTQILNKAAAEILSEPEFSAKLKKIALIPQGRQTPRQLNAEMTAEYKSWGDLIKAKNIKAN